MKKFVRRLKERKELNGNNIEFKVERTVTKNDKSELEVITESDVNIITNIESTKYIYYVGNSSTIVEVVNSIPKYIRSVLNESIGDNIDSLPTY